LRVELDLKIFDVLHHSVTLVLHSRFRDCYLEKIELENLQKGNVILATNLAGHGTDNSFICRTTALDRINLLTFQDLKTAGT
jgi:hypothetical protein